MRHFFISVFGFLLGIQSIFGQDLWLPLNVRAEDAQYNKLIMVVPVFGIRNDSVSNPLDVSSAKAGDEVLWYKTKLPNMNANFRWGFAWLFDGSSNSKEAKSYTLLAIENPGWTAFPSKIWIDRNHNFDFTDDGGYDSISLNKGTILKLGDAAENGYQVFVEHFPSAKFSSFEIMNDKAVGQLKGNRYFMGTSASLRERRLNVIASNWTNGSDSFCIGIKDVNCNGRYDDEGIDVAMITSYNGVFDNLQGIKLNNKGEAYLEWHNASYQIVGVSKDKKQLHVIRDTASRLLYSLNVGDKIPKFKYCTSSLHPKHVRVRKLKGKYTYIYVWRDGNPEFEKDSAAWHALGRLERADFQVLGLNYGASGRFVFQYNRHFETSIIQGFSSNDVNKVLKIKKIPTGILVDRKMRIVAVDLAPSEVLPLLTTN